MPDPAAPAEIGTSRPRLILIDAARGLALCGMVVFHSAWDLAFFRWSAWDPSRQSFGILFGHAVACAFLLLSGIGLVLAAPRGRRAALRRIGRIGAAAALVTLATGLVFGQGIILFGILHCIALGNLIALSLLDASPWVLLGLAGLIAGAPALLASHRFDALPWSWLGLAITPPPTLDYRPLLPWTALILLGVVIGHGFAWERLPRPRGRGLMTLAAAGRHSLAIYLLHQPIIFAILLPLSWAFPPEPDLASFGQACRTDCRHAGAGAELCEAACGCVTARLAARMGQPWPNEAAIAALGRACLAGLPKAKFLESH